MFNEYTILETSRPIFNHFATESFRELFMIVKNYDYYTELLYLILNMYKTERKQRSDTIYILLEILSLHTLFEQLITCTYKLYIYIYINRIHK